MNTKIISHWKIELFDSIQTGSIASGMKRAEKIPFFIGYSRDPISGNRLYGQKFLTLGIAPDSVASQSILVDQITEVRCTPVFEQEVDEFSEAAEPLIKWMAENVHPHHSAIVTSTGAELLMSERVHNTDKFLKD